MVPVSHFIPLNIKNAPDPASARLFFVERLSIITTVWQAVQPRPLTDSDDIDMKQRIAILIINLLGAFAIQAAPASGIDFNTDLLDVADRENIDFEQFTHVGYIVPGKYTMQVNINDRSLGEREITVKSDADGASISCIPKTLLEEFGLKESALQKVLQANTDMQCINLDVLEGSTLRPDISSYTLTISIPQTNLEYIDDNWEPISRWDNGINGFMLDYGINLQHATSSEQWENNTNASAYGVLGANYGAWRVRADWQAQYQSNRGWHTQKPPQDEDQQDQDEPQDPTHPKQVKETHQQHSADVTRVYAYRPLPSREEKLMVGELDLGNSIFDSFRFTGLTLASDDNMLPPTCVAMPPKWSVSPKPTPRWSSARGTRSLRDPGRGRPLPNPGSQLGHQRRAGRAGRGTGWLLANLQGQYRRHPLSVAPRLGTLQVCQRQALQPRPQPGRAAVCQRRSLLGSTMAGPSSAAPW